MKGPQDRRTTTDEFPRRLPFALLDAWSAGARRYWEIADRLVGSTARWWTQELVEYQ